jgi:multidrug resistance protein
VAHKSVESEAFMNKIERQSRSAADDQLFSDENLSDEILSDEVAQELTRLPTEVIELGDAPSITPKAPLTQAEVRTILMSLLLTMFLAALDQTIVATALPTIGRQFGDVNNLSWVITAYLLASTAVAPVFGTLSDIYGRRATIITAMSLFMVGSILCALAPNMIVLIIARALQGLGGGGILPIVQTVISDVVSPRERGQYQAYFSGVWVAAGIGGPILGGVFAEHLHWSMIFWINIPLGIVALALLLPKMKKIPVFHRKRKVDWLGGVLLMASAVVFMLVLTWGGTRYPWLSPTVIAMLGGAVALAVTFVWHARRADEPFLPLKLLTGSARSRVSPCSCRFITSRSTTSAPARPALRSFRSRRSRQSVRPSPAAPWPVQNTTSASPLPARRGLRFARSASRSRPCRSGAC